MDKKAATPPWPRQVCSSSAPGDPALLHSGTDGHCGRRSLLPSRQLLICERLGDDAVLCMGGSGRDRRRLLRARLAGPMKARFAHLRVFDASGAGVRVRGCAAAGRARRRSPATATGRCLAVTLTRSVSAPLVAQWSSRALCGVVSDGHRTATASPTIATVISARLSSSWILRSIAACSPAKASRTSHSYQSAHAAAATARSFRARWRTR